MTVVEMDKPGIHEFDDRFYIVTPVYEQIPEAGMVAQFDQELLAGLDILKEKAPNPHLLWMQGRYVEADKANDNGHLWTAGDLAIAALTPNLTPVTVMHDPSTAVGMVADARMVSSGEGVERARIDTTLAIWKHRFPEVAAEASVNAKQGTLMQSMECRANHYECSVCAQKYVPLPAQSERANWCSHLKGEVSASDGRILGAARILRGTTFTGTGLIFGTRGAKGAYTEAHLEVEELAEFHARLSHDTPRRTTKMAMIQVEESEYQRIQRERDEATAKVTDLSASTTDLQTKVEQAEAAKAQAEQKAADEKARADKAEELVNQSKLKTERLGSLGAGFKAKLAGMTATNQRVEQQAQSLTDDEWAARLDELEELLSVKRDAPAEAGSEAGKEEGKENGNGGGSGTFSAEQLAGAGFGQATDASKDNVKQRQAVVGGLARSFAKKQ